jgi:hypothetical protein
VATELSVSWILKLQPGRNPPRWSRHLRKRAQKNAQKIFESFTVQDGEFGAPLWGKFLLSYPPMLRLTHNSAAISMGATNMEASIIGTSLVTIVEELQGFERQGWVVTAYLITYTSKQPCRQIGSIAEH